MLKYPAIIHKEDEGYWIEFPDLKGCHTEGDTFSELVENAEEALGGYLGVLFDDKMEIPDPTPGMKGKEIIYIAVPPDVSIPVEFRKLRKEKKLSQTEIAKRINVTQQTYRRFEDVERFNGQIRTIDKIFRAMGKRFEYRLVDAKQENNIQAG